MDDRRPGVSLAQSAAISIGELRINPAAREIELGTAREMLQPRVMQVLIALAQEIGSVVSRDTLIDRCWDGRAISDDALNRVIAKIRRVALGTGGSSFAVETVTKVGYRLHAAEGRPTPVGSAAPPSRDANSAAPLVVAAMDLETRGLSLLFQGTAQQTSDGIDYLRQATAAAPERAPLWGSLAMGYVLALPFTTAALIPQVAARAEEAANRALCLDDKEGRAIAAQISLRPTFRNWEEKDRLLSEGFARARPGTPPLMFQRVQFLASVGQTTEALDLVEQLCLLSPLLPWIQSARAQLLAATGRLEDAQQVAELAWRTWPRDKLSWFTRFNLDLFCGRPGDALRMAEAPSQRPEGSEADVELGVAAGEALLDGSNAAIDRVVGMAAERSLKDRASAEIAVQVAALLGRHEEALSLAHQMYDHAGVLSGRGHVLPKVGMDDGHERNTALLFFQPMTPLRGQKGFADLIDYIGLRRIAETSG